VVSIEKKQTVREGNAPLGRVHEHVDDRLVQGKTLNKDGKNPYCWRCLTKGHTMHGCIIELWCDILSHLVLEGKPNANLVRARIRNSRTQRLHNWTSSHIAQNK
jgi:hypothetical protein